MNKIIITIILFVALTVLISVKICYDEALYSDRIFFTNLIIQVISLIIIFTKPNYPYSLYKIFGLFSYFFFGIAPLMQFVSNSIFYGAPDIKEEQYFHTNLIVIFILVFFVFLYNLFYLNYNLEKFNAEKYIIRFNRINFNQSIFLILVGIIGVFSILMINDYDIASSLIRGGELKIEVEQGDKSIYLIVNNFVRPLVMVTFLLTLIVEKKNYLLIFIISFFALFACFPTAIPRFALGALYIPLLILLFPFLRKTNRFVIFFILNLLIVFPFFNKFRRLESETSYSLDLNFDMFNEGHFDSYSSLLYTLEYDFITNGNQLLGSLLFFVPRSIWSDKPVGSGSYLAEKLGFTYDNIACNFFAEGYMNFGYFGIIIFVTIFAYFLSKFDKIYWNLFIDNPEKNYFQIIYLFLISLTFFILRGDLLSSFAYTIGFISSVLFLLTIMNLLRTK